MKKIDIGKLTDFTNFSNANDGITIYKKEKIKMTHYEFIKDGVCLFFEVLSTRNITHISKISVNKDNELIDISCSCTYRNSKSDICKHLSASYIYFLNKLTSLDNNCSYDFSSLGNISSSLSNNFLRDNFNYRLYFSIVINNSNDVKLRLGIILNKTYWISNLWDFLNCIYEKVPYKINKSISLNLSEDNFENTQKLFIEKLLCIHSLINLNALIKENVFSNEFLILNRRLLDDVLKIIEKDVFSIEFRNENFDECKIINEDLNISPLISSDSNKNIILSIELEGILNIFENSPYFYFKGNIYKVSDSMIENYKCLKNLISTNNTSYFKINEENKSSFLNKTLPELSKHFNLEIHENLSDIIKIEHCVTKFYIDKTPNDIIVLKVVFNYGGQNINPLDDSISNNSILRDYQTENSILNSLNNICECKSSIYFLIKSPNKIVEFKEEGIKTLRELGEIYYTKNFQKYKIISSSSYKTSFSMGLDNLLNISFSFDGITNEELYLAIKNIRKGEKYLKLKGKGILNLDNTYLNQINDILIDLDINEDQLKEDSLKLNKFYALYLNSTYSNKFENTGELNIDSNFIEMTNKILNLEVKDLNPPKNLIANLRAYQLEGFKWLRTLKECNLSGILADEMGLGKTLQTIAFLQKEYENKSLNTSIIICPKSLIYNWSEEIRKFAPDLKVLIFNGNKNIRLRLMKEFKNYDVILTSYGIVQKDIDDLKDECFNICIIDEAQNIKNKTSKNTISLRKLNVNYKFALTGTPIENSIDELWSIFNFLMPGYLHSYVKFKSLYESSDEDSSTLIENLRKKISPFILRRLKQNVLTELPPKIESKIMVELNDEQKKLYYSYVEKFKNEFDTNSNLQNEQNLKFKMLSALTRLRQICCEPKVIMENYYHGSSKIDALMEIIDDNIKSNKKIIVFSNFTSVLEIIKNILIENKIKYKYLDGSTPSKERIDIVNDFNKNDSNVFLISLKAGGFGLNITSAETVVHFDPWWNNAVENQATDRAHRIGQKNTIHVIKLITKGTIEEKIFEIQNKKSIMINSIIKDNELAYNSISKMSIEQLKSLFLTYGL